MCEDPSCNPLFLRTTSSPPPSPPAYTFRAAPHVVYCRARFSGPVFPGLGFPVHPYMARLLMLFNVLARNARSMFQSKAYPSVRLCGSRPLRGKDRTGLDFDTRRYAGGGCIARQNEHKCKLRGDCPKFSERGIGADESACTIYATAANTPGAARARAQGGYAGRYQPAHGPTSRREWWAQTVWSGASIGWLA